MMDETMKGVSYVYPIYRDSRVYWVVKKWINGRFVVFGTFKDYDEAVAYRNKLIVGNWDLCLKHERNDEVNVRVKSKFLEVS